MNFINNGLNPREKLAVAEEPVGIMKLGTSSYSLEL